MGLAVDPNTIIPLKKNIQDLDADEEQIEAEETNTIRALRSDARPSEIPVFVSLEERKFYDYLLSRYGENYEVSVKLFALLAHAERYLVAQVTFLRTQVLKRPRNENVLRNCVEDGSRLAERGSTDSKATEAPDCSLPTVARAQAGNERGAVIARSLTADSDGLEQHDALAVVHFRFVSRFFYHLLVCELPGIKVILYNFCGFSSSSTPNSEKICCYFSLSFFHFSLGLVSFGFRETCIVNKLESFGSLFSSATEIT